MLPEHVCRLLEEIEQGDLYPAVFLGTRDPEAGARVRTVLLARWDPQAGFLYLGSDVRHRKREELQADPVAEVCAVRLEGGPLQLRFRCRFRVLGGHEADAEPLRRLWGQVPGHDRVRFYDAPADEDEPSPFFLGLEGDVVEIDLLDLRANPPSRLHYHRDEGAWVEAEYPV